MTAFQGYDGAAWRRVLADLASQLDPSKPAELVVIGGAAIALVFDTRRTTLDVDVVISCGDVESNLMKIWELFDEPA